MTVQDHTNIVIAAFAVLSFLVSLFSYRVSRNMKAVAQRQAKDLASSVAVARVSADAAKASVELAWKSMVLSQPPRLRIGHIGVACDRKQFREGVSRLDGQFRITNIGSTPAHVANPIVSAFLSDSGVPMWGPFDTVPPAEASITTLQPGQNMKKLYNTSTAWVLCKPSAF